MASCLRQLLQLFLSALLHAALARHVSSRDGERLESAGTVLRSRRLQSVNPSTEVSSANACTGDLPSRYAHYDAKCEHCTTYGCNTFVFVALGARRRRRTAGMMCRSAEGFFKEEQCKSKCCAEDVCAPDDLLCTDIDGLEWWAVLLIVVSTLICCGGCSYAAYIAWRVFGSSRPTVHPSPKTETDAPANIMTTGSPRGQQRQLGPASPRGSPRGNTIVPPPLQSPRPQPPSTLSPKLAGEVGTLQLPGNSPRSNGSKDAPRSPRGNASKDPPQSPRGSPRQACNPLWPHGNGQTYKKQPDLGNKSPRAIPAHRSPRGNVSKPNFVTPGELKAGAPKT